MNSSDTKHRIIAQWLSLVFNGIITCPGKPRRDLHYFTFSENDTGNDANTSPLKNKLSTEGLLILLTEGISTRMNQTEHINHQT